MMCDEELQHMQPPAGGNFSKVGLFEEENFEENCR